MKWKTNERPKDGDLRERIIYCIIPFRWDGYTYWLHRLKILELCKECKYVTYADGTRVIYWDIVDIEEL